MGAKEQFCSIVNAYIHRDGIDDLMKYLENETDFFISPASTEYHGSYPGGLVEHSLNVYDMLICELEFIFGRNWTKRYTMETVAIVALFHDVCKCGRYEAYMRNSKDPETGVWKEHLAYKFNPEYTRMGHAPLSLHRIERYMKLSDEEAQAIFCHMGAFDLSNYFSSLDLSTAFSRNQLAYALHRADMDATHITENKFFVPVPDDEQDHVVQDEQ